MKKILVPIAQGFEEIELVSIVDVLRRAGVEVTLASISSEDFQEGAHCIKIMSDCLLDEVQSSDFDGIVLAGGMQGVQNMNACEKIRALLQEFHQEQKMIGAICAAPIILDALKLLNFDFCCYPQCEILMKNKTHRRLNQGVSIYENYVTGSGPAFAIEFSIAIVNVLLGEEKKLKLQKELLLLQEI